MLDVLGEKCFGIIQLVFIVVCFLKILVNVEGELVFGEVVWCIGIGGFIVYCYLQSLVKEGLVCQDLFSGFYDFGLVVLSIGIGVLKWIDVVDIVVCYMKVLV